MKNKIKVSVVGGTGYTGVELLRLLSQHPYVEIHHITSRGDEGKLVADIYPSMRGIISNQFINPDKADLKNSDLVFFATPNGIAMNYAKNLLSEGVKIIDLAADFRIKDVAVWEKWYGMAHTSKDLLGEAVYGLPEINREKIKKARLVANPGCYPTAIQLGLLPLIKNNLINKNNIIADAKSGISGAGKKLEPSFLMAEASESFKAYGIEGHRHLPEMEENLSACANGERVKLTFVPHLLPMVRGIHATLYVDATEEFDLSALYENFYSKEPFVDIMPESTCPDTKSVRASNICRIAPHKEIGTSRIIILSVIDNLMKGAAGQAVQNMNIMMGFEEVAGLVLGPITP
ncbi:MAG: N-acetyl-gamma-glutamyl-phosphate reductase [Methylophilales bacterium BACL14 MAG-120920-bin58]|jgi:N-acetyl-gamma-glutamyl-phosphate reductase|nr:MAG: N-acetyl-gamma-glutamyl-phosphate reductase [Methylophilales bacterium BACL14 MAG-120920-bin58]|tara:strand:+ start:69 stop:1109 length:1041 start_codon:yes stop_codon:yes gene_type:complete